MTVQEFINAIRDKPHLWNMELCAVTGVGKVESGLLDGAVRAQYKSVVSAVMANDDLLLFIDPASNDKAYAFPGDASKWPSATVAGETPDVLKW